MRSKMVHSERDRPLRRRGVRVTVIGAVAALGLSSVAVASSYVPSEAGPGGSGNSISAGTDPDVNLLSLGAQWWPYSPGPGQLGAAPQVFAFDHVVDGRRTKESLMTIGRNEDSGTAVLHSEMKVAKDNALEFRDYDKLPDGFNWASAGHLSDGSLMALLFVPVAAPAPNRLGISVAVSTDQGASWARHLAPIVENKWKMDWYRVTRDTLQLPDGTILQGVYGSGTVNGVAGQYSMILQSTDDGKSFSQRSLVNTDGASNEMALSRTSDGRLIAITRTAEGSGQPTQPMKQAYSGDDGMTWTPQQVFTPPEGLPSEGIMPQLVLQANGVLMLTYGRPDNNIAVSWDGSGSSWNDGKVVFANYIRTTERGRSMGSSGNTALTAAQANYSMNYGDICHNIWSCREHGQLTGIWAQRVDAVTAGKGKLDLATGVADGVMKLSGTVVAADPTFAEQRLQGAVDGSSDYRAAARFTEGAKKVVTVTLDRVYTLNKIGLMLDRGVSNSAKVQLSVDGRNWSAPVIRQRDVKDYSVRYTDIDPTEAKYVRVSNIGSQPFTALNELELYAANMWTFENDAVNVSPRGTTDTLHAFTADTIMPGQHSQRRAILVDMDPDTRATMTFPVPILAKGLHLDFGYTGEGYGSGAIWELTGKDAAGAAATPWRFLFKPAGDGFSLSSWDGATWQTVGTFPTFTPNYQWIPVVINANSTQAAVTVHGKTVVTKVTAAKAATLNGFRPSTGLMISDQNMEHSYDNVQISPLGNYTVGAADPGSLITFPKVAVSTSISVQNFTNRAVSLPVTVNNINGYRVHAPRYVIVAPNSNAQVAVTVTRQTTNTAPRTLTVRIGDQQVSVPITVESDWVRSATMSASSTTANSSPSNLNTGNTDSGVWGGGGAGGWNDNTSKTFPDWVVATWKDPVKLSKVDVYTLDSPTDPATKWGLRDYDVQVKTAAGDWRTVDEVRGSTVGTVTSTFAAVQTTAIRILITDTNDHGYSRLIAVQAFS